MVFGTYLQGIGKRQLKNAKVALVETGFTRILIVLNEKLSLEQRSSTKSTVLACAPISANIDLDGI
ncbi:hypothetical protein DP83_07195 [Vibrio metoecus]|uniref:Uncharacterized protein n=1 Tax=Vibrio metoecus TaxID=1481663 RepID=A0ABR4RXZ8_VIBMT|nr:hypothetical protein DP83_07195 [Vibrio metoecus]